MQTTREELALTAFDRLFAEARTSQSAPIKWPHRVALAAEKVQGLKNR
jgi:hypothetical protein